MNADNLSPGDFDLIQRANDLFRRTEGNVDDSVLWQAGLASQGKEFRDAVLRAIRGDNDFSHDQGDLHDFGIVEVDGQKIEWMIVYLDNTASNSSPATATRRVMSIAAVN